MLLVIPVLRRKVSMKRLIFLGLILLATFLIAGKGTVFTSSRAATRISDLEDQVRILKEEKEVLMRLSSAQDKFIQECEAVRRTHYIKELR